MPLSSSSEHHLAFFETKAVLFDTCALTWFAKTEAGMVMLDQILVTYRVLVPTPVLYELAFGPDQLVDNNEMQLRSRIHVSSNCVELLDYSISMRQGRGAINGFLVINPGFNEWWTARTRLLAHVGVSNRRPGKAKKEYSLDALIHATARNCFAPICTANISDFEMLNTTARPVWYDRSVPLFHPEDLIRSLTEVVRYEDGASVSR